MFVFGLLIVSANYVFRVLVNPTARKQLMEKRVGLIPFIGWALVLLGTALQLIDNLSKPA